MYQTTNLQRAQLIYDTTHPKTDKNKTKQTNKTNIDLFKLITNYCLDDI